MGDSSWELIFQQDVQDHIDQHGMAGIEQFYQARLGQWNDVEINIGVTGDVGSGKSSFINAIRGLEDEEEGAADTGVNETTKEAAVYPHPTNVKIKFWDLPGLGTPKYPDLKIYSDNVGLEKYDTFLILTTGPFTANDLLLAKKVKSMKKLFFFVRTKIDQDVQNEERKSAFNEEAMLNDIRRNCMKNLEALGTGGNDVFLISNRKTAEWDFARLTQAILDVLPRRQKESLTLSLDLLTSQSKDILKRKVEILGARIWMVAAVSAACTVLPPRFSVAVDVAILIEEINFYKSQLCLPDENSREFQRMCQERQERMREICLISMERIGTLLAAYANSSRTEFVKYIPFVGKAIGGSVSFVSTYLSLKQYLNEMEGIALALLDDMNTRVVDDLDIN